MAQNLRSEILLTLLILVASVVGLRKRYDGHEVWKVIPKTPTQLDFLIYLHDHADKYELDFWNEPSAIDLPVMIRVPPNRQTETGNLLGLRGLSFQVNIADVEGMIDQEFKSRAQNSQPRLYNFNYGEYHSLDEVNAWMFGLAARFPHRVSLFNISKSYEGRNIMGIKITGTKSSSTKPGFFFNGGMHAREWLSPATVIYIAGQLIEQYGVNPVLTKMVDSIDWYALPIFNVDGYVYSRTTDRLWRKTRSRHPGRRCVGVDPNRNFDWKWCTTGASSNPCSEQYCGPRVLSEIEVRGLADFLGAVKGRFRAYVDFHNYSQLWLIPWGYSRRYTSSFLHQDRCAALAVKAVKAVHGTRYRHGTAAQTLYPVTGGVMDWAHGSVKIPYTATVELRDSGRYGFLVPADQIIPSGEETLQGILSLAQCIQSNP